MSDGPYDTSRRYEAAERERRHRATLRDRLRSHARHLRLRVDLEALRDHALEVGLSEEARAELARWITELKGTTGDQR